MRFFNQTISRSHQLKQGIQNSFFLQFQNDTHQAASGGRPQIWSKLQSVQLSLYCSFRAFNGHKSNSGQPGKVTRFS